MYFVDKDGVGIIPTGDLKNSGEYPLVIYLNYKYYGLKFSLLDNNQVKVFLSHSERILINDKNMIEKQIIFKIGDYIMDKHKNSGCYYSCFMILNIWTTLSLKEQVKNLQNEMGRMNSYLRNEVRSTNSSINNMKKDLLKK